jgi:hypothetical protein
MLIVNIESTDYAAVADAAARHRPLPRSKYQA